MDLIINKVRKSKTVYKAIIMNSCFLGLALLFCDLKYEISDDFVMQTILEGAYGNDYNPHLLFSNILIGYVLVGLYRIVPSVGWFFVMQIVLNYISLLIILCIIFNEIKNNKIAFVVSLIVLSLFSDDLYVLITFTKTAAAAVMAGGMLVLYSSISNLRHKRIAMSVGWCVCLLGSMLRYNTVKLAFPFLLLVLSISICIECRVKEWKNKRNVVIKEIGIFLLLFISIFSLSQINKIIWNSDEVYGEYKAWNQIRASITDVSGIDNDEMIEVVTGAGYTLEDSYMLTSWEFLDQDYFTQDVLSTIAQMKKEACEKKVRNITEIMQELSGRGYISYPVFWGVVLLLVVTCMYIDRRSAIWCIGSLLMLLLELLYYVYMLRIVYRVEWGSFFCAACVIIYIIVVKNRQGVRKDKPIYNLLFSIMVFLICVYRIMLYIPDEKYRTMSDDEYRNYVYETLYESWNYNYDKYKICVSKRSPYQNLIELMENDDEHYYLCDFSTTIQLLYYNYKPWKSMKIGYYADSYSYLGGVTAYYPEQYDVWANNGIDYKNPYKSISNENIRIVDNYYYLTKVRYYNEKYDSLAVENLVDEIDGMKIWEIY